MYTPSIFSPVEYETNRSGSERSRFVRQIVNQRTVDIHRIPSDLLNM